MGVTYVRKYDYTLDSVARDLDEMPDAEEVQRLIDNYPSYTLKHRRGLLKDICDGAEPLVMTENKLNAKGIEAVTKQEKGGHTRWVISKLVRFTIRVLYLRYRIDQGLTKRQANSAIFKKLPFFTIPENYESAKRTIRNHTAYAKIDS